MKKKTLNLNLPEKKKARNLFMEHVVLGTTSTKNKPDNKTQPANVFARLVIPIDCTWKNIYDLVLLIASCQNTFV